MKSFLDDRVFLYPGDCMEVLPRLAENSVDAVCCDPPYHLASIVERFGAEGAAPARSNGATGIYARASAGFMGQQWDGGDVAFDPETWRNVLRVLKPGGHLVAFAAPKNGHLLTGAVERAGFEIRDRIVDLISGDEHVLRFLSSLSSEQRDAFFLCLEESGFGGELLWVFGTGFPKSLKPGERIDRHLFDDDEWDRGERSHRAAFWSQFGTALKPAYEPIILARKPLIGTVAENVLRYGTGAINIDACRVAVTDDAYAKNAAGDRGHANNRKRDMDFALGAGRAHDLGRWPANILHDGSDEVLAAFPHTASGTGAIKKATGTGYRANAYGAESRPAGTPNVEYGDAGSAARFFFQATPDHRCSLCDALIVETLSRTESIPIAATADGDARGSPSPDCAVNGSRENSGAKSAAKDSRPCPPPTSGSAPSDVPTRPPEEIVRNVLSAADLCNSCATDIARALVAVGRGDQLGKSPITRSIATFKETILSHCLASYVASRESTDTILTTESLTGLFGSVFHAIGDYINSAKSEASTEFVQSRFWYSSKADSDDRIGSKHPTVKPVDLMRWLCRLITPPGGTILDPFAGTGTTGEAAFYEGFSAILIEREPEYLADIERRMALVLAGPSQRAVESAKARADGKKPDHGPLFASIST